MSSRAGWYPDPGGQPNTYRYWDGKVWSAATTHNPSSAPPNQGLVQSGPTAGATQTGQAYGQREYGPQSYGGTPGFGQQSAYAGYQTTTQKKSGRGWWVAGAALVVVLVVIIVVAVRQLGGAGGIASGDPGGQGSQDPCPQDSAAASVEPDPADGRVHGGPISYPELGAPWQAPSPDRRVPFGSDVLVQDIPVQTNYDGKGASWVASVLVGRLAAGDGFFTPKQGSQIVVKCILGKFYGNAEVKSDVIQNKATTVDGHDAWIVESKLSFDIQGLDTKGERLIVVIISATASTSGLYYASIPDTVPQYLPVARNLIGQLKVDG